MENIQENNLQECIFLLVFFSSTSKPLYFAVLNYSKQNSRDFSTNSAR